MDESSPINTEMQIGKYKVRIDRDLCIGAASCVAMAPGTFDLDGENKVIFIDGANDAEESLLMAAQSCPTKAIIITDVESGEVVWPK